jgi:hypothetical protein
MDVTEVGWEVFDWFHLANISDSGVFS